MPVIELFDFEVIQNMCNCWSIFIHVSIISAAIYIVGLNIAYLVDRTTVSNSFVTVIMLSMMFLLCAAYVLNAMVSTTSTCKKLPLAINRLRFNVVKHNGNHTDRKDITTLYESVTSLSLGFKLSGVLVTSKVAAQIIYSSITILSLVLFGRAGRAF